MEALAPVDCVIVAVILKGTGLVAELADAHA